MSTADPIAPDAGERRSLVAAEIGSGRLEGAELNDTVATLADVFASGDIDEFAVAVAVEQHQHEVAAQTRQRLHVVGG